MYTIKMEGSRPFISKEFAFGLLSLREQERLKKGAIEYSRLYIAASEALYNLSRPNEDEIESQVEADYPGFKAISEKAGRYETIIYNAGDDPDMTAILEEQIRALQEGFSRNNSRGNFS